jgi:anhydro-N-acetylmuramic acid kinase
MTVAGVMSGTSADGVDVAVCRIGQGRREGDSPRMKLIGHLETPYPKAVRAQVLRVMQGEAVTAAEMSRLNWRLGAIYADCVERAAAEYGVRIGLVGCHGQTVHHEAGMGGAAGVQKADSSASLRNDKQASLRNDKQRLGRGEKLRSTSQMGEAAVIAERMRCPVVSDFRPADLAAGGQGAPLVPMLDWCMFRSPKVSRVLLNLGGIGNVTGLPAGCGMDGVMAFDTGPGNMVIDHCMERLFGRAFDTGGTVARRGRVIVAVVETLMRERYFSALPPKSCGREQFGMGFAERLIAMCRAAGGVDADCVATATALTAESVIDAYRRFVWAHLGTAAPLAKAELCVAGGGAKNAALMGMLREGFAGLAVSVREMEELGVPAQAKEGVAFALLAWLTWNGLPGNIPAATGAARAVVLGKVSYG